METKTVVRIRTRLSLKLPMWIHSRESADYGWTEKSRLIDVNQFGAGFTLTRPVEVGRLIQVTTPLPHQLRCFDQLEPLYSVWSLVRHISLLPQEATVFRVGVAFIGKRVPASYEEDPTLLYEPVPLKIGHSVMWNIAQRAPTIERREARLLLPLEVTVETFDENGKPCAQEHTVTEMISSLGACFPSTLDVAVGRIIRISSSTENVSVFAAVRSRSVMADGIARVGVEFVADRWPLQRESSFIYQKTNLDAPHEAM